MIKGMERRRIKGNRRTNQRARSVFGVIKKYILKRIAQIRSTSLKTQRIIVEMQ